MAEPGQRKFNVLALTEGYPHGAGLAGIFHVDQFRELAANGINLTVAGATPWVPPGLERFPQWARYNAGPVRQEVDGFTVYRPRYPAIPGEARWLRPHWIQAAMIGRLPIPRPDIIHAFFALPQGATARILARRWKVPYLVTCLGGDVTHLTQQSAYHRNLFRDVLTDASTAMANGPSLAWQAAKLANTSVETYPLGTDGKRFIDLPGKSAARAELSLPLDKTLVLFVGSLSEEKGVTELLRAMARLDDPDLCCVLVGTGPLLNQAKATPGCITVGFQDNSRLPAFHAAADMFVLPSHSEGLPTVMIEAGLAGTPVIGSDIPPIRDLLDDDRGLLTPVGEAEALARAITDVRDDAAAAARRAEHLMKHVNETYEVRPATHKLVGLYERSIPSLTDAN